MTSFDWGIVTRRWMLCVFLVWLAASAWFVNERWNAIGWFALGDTDDNLRIAQVRAWLSGQGWFDLRQYKLNPPFGADIHWSRFVDLPIAGIKLGLAPFVGGLLAEKTAVAVAPLLPMLVAMFALAGTARRLLAPWAFFLGLAFILCGPSVRGMWMPLRIDHHGWQLAMLGIVVLGLVDPKRARGGVTVGVATALSLAIGLEMLLYLALAGAATGLRWVWDRDETRRRLAAYGASLAGASAFFFLIFTSYSNRAPVCDAFSPVWFSVMVAAGALAFVLAYLNPQSRWARFGAAAGAALLLGAGYALVWPHCLGRLEGSTPELDTLWLSHVREARPIYTHSMTTIVSGVSMPLMGLIGYAVMIWRNRRDQAAVASWASVAVLALLAASLLLWQTRAAPAAQLLAVPGVAALAWLLVQWLFGKKNWLIGVPAAVAAFFLVSGLGAQYIARQFPQGSGANKGRSLVNAANAQCPTLPALRPIAQEPKGTVLTHVDLGPRLISVTPHNAIAGPYHRNQADIIAVMRAFRGSADNAYRTVTEREVDYILICPNLSESTIYRAQAPTGFYVQLTKGQVPSWLEQVELPANSPYRMWKVRR